MESQIYLAEPWFQPAMCSFGNVNDCSSSDLYNTCHIDNPPYANVGVPLNDFGYQYARTGDGYAGIGFWINNGARERIEVKLLESLKKDSIYCVSMFVVNKLAVSIFPPISMTSTSNLQFLFTADSLIDNNPIGAVYYVPSVKNPDELIITDTSNWTKISGCYKALGGESYLTIGSFFNDANSTTTNSSSEGAYYFIDDVSVGVYNGMNCSCPEYDDSLDSMPDDQSYFIPNAFTPNEDGVNDILTTKFVDDEEYMIIYNRWGNVVVRLDIDQPAWNGRIGGKLADDGVYFYTAFLRGEIKTGFIHLVR